MKFFKNIRTMQTVRNLRQSFISNKPFTLVVAGFTLGFCYDKIKSCLTSSYKIIVFVPTSHVEEVKKAMFNQGGGKAINYNQCAWQVLGDGQFFAYGNANPYIGKKNELTKVPEYYVEMYCSYLKIRNVVNALKKAHPYEEPAYQVIKMESF